MTPPGPAGGIAAVIGDPVAHSLSPTLHAAAYGSLGLDWTYLACRVRRGDAAAALEGARALGFVGLSVTMPHKQAALYGADQRSIVAEQLGAANTVTFRAGIAVADSTDGDALLDDLAEGGFDPAGRRCAVIGAGGAARAAVLALALAGAREVLVVNRTVENAASAVALAAGRGRIAQDEELAACDLVVQATPLGMSGTGAESIERSASLGRLLGSGQLVLDMVYAPRETALLQEAAARGARTRGGIGVLVHQAARQVRIWTGEEPPIDAMRTAVAEAGTGAWPGTRPPIS